MQVCPSCGTIITEFWKVCQHCGNKFKVGAKRKAEARYCSSACKEEHDRLEKRAKREIRKLNESELTSA